MAYDLEGYRIAVLYDLPRRAWFGYVIDDTTQEPVFVTDPIKAPRLGEKEDAAKTKAEWFCLDWVARRRPKRSAAWPGSIGGPGFCG